MLAHLFLGLSLIGAEWVLYLLLILSVFSVSLIVERALFYREASKGLTEFRANVRKAVSANQTASLVQLAETRIKERHGKTPDLESEMVRALATARRAHPMFWLRSHKTPFFAPASSGKKIFPFSPPSAPMLHLLAFSGQF
jgi:biopolymer transport protein ExbB/TolQ